ncbi:MAG: hypothetical protein R3C56_00905 [Pirellulaceae bacterium]
MRGASAWSPCSLEPTHTDLYWYGVHGVEILYTAMGPGCQNVTRIHTDGTDMAVGVWQDGRVGDFRGIRDGAGGYGLVVFGEKQIEVEASTKAMHHSCIRSQRSSLVTRHLCRRMRR